MCALQIALSPELGHSGLKSQSCFVSPSCAGSSERARVFLFPAKGLGSLGWGWCRGNHYSVRIKDRAASNYSRLMKTGSEIRGSSQARCSESFDELLDPTLASGEGAHCVGSVELRRKHDLGTDLKARASGKEPFALPGMTEQQPLPLVMLPDGFRTFHISKTRLYANVGSAEAADSSFCDQSKSSFSQLHSVFSRDFSSLGVDRNERCLHTTNGLMASLSSSLSVLMCYSGPAYAIENRTLNPVYGDVGAVLEIGVQLLYLGALLTLLGVGSFLVVRQVLIKRELETAAKELQDRVRSGEASSLEYFELGAVMLRKKFYQVARKHLNDAIKKWDGSEQDLAQVYNALGYSYFSDGKVEQAIKEYEKAVKLQPMYVTAWNNLADAYETQKNYTKALKAYEEALQFDPSNQIATAKREQMKERVEKFQGIP